MTFRQYFDIIRSMMRLKQILILTFISILSTREQVCAYITEAKAIALDIQLTTDTAEKHRLQQTRDDILDKLFNMRSLAQFAKIKFISFYNSDQMLFRAINKAILMGEQLRSVIRDLQDEEIVIILGYHYTLYYINGIGGVLRDSKCFRVNQKCENFDAIKQAVLRGENLQGLQCPALAGFGSYDSVILETDEQVVQYINEIRLTSTMPKYNTLTQY